MSTKRRLSSATSGPSTYYETGVFELDEEMRPVKTMAIVDVGVSSKSALDGHFEICRQVCEKIAAEDDNE